MKDDYKILLRMQNLAKSAPKHCRDDAYFYEPLVSGVTCSGSVSTEE